MLAYGALTPSAMAETFPELPRRMIVPLVAEFIADDGAYRINLYLNGTLAISLPYLVRSLPSV
jgi:hypothetical protein